jgi:hypothetical protein
VGEKKIITMTVQQREQEKKQLTQKTPEEKSPKRKAKVETPEEEVKARKKEMANMESLKWDSRARFVQTSDAFATFISILTKSRELFDISNHCPHVCCSFEFQPFASTYNVFKTAAVHLNFSTVV